MVLSQEIVGIEEGISKKYLPQAGKPFSGLNWKVEVVIQIHFPEIGGVILIGHFHWLPKFVKDTIGFENLTVMFWFKSLTNQVGLTKSTKACKKILKYFGEKNIKLCGKCDVCLGRHKVQNVNYTLENEILRIVSEGECNYQKILQKVKTGNSEEAKVTLRKLVEQNVLEIKNYEVYLKNPRK